MTGVQIRRQVLKAMAALTTATAQSLERHIPTLTPKQIQKALYNLCADDEIRKIGEEPRGQAKGRPWNVYRIRDEESPKDTGDKKVYKKTSRKNNAQSLQRPVTFDGDRSMWVVRYRERKISLFTRLLVHVGGTDKDLLIGCINDYKS